MRLPRVRFTIRRMMVVVAVIALILGLFAANPLDQDVVAVLLLTSMVLIGPVFFAIAGNRRDAININADRTGHPDSQAPAWSPHRAIQRTRPVESAVNGEP